MEIQDQIASIEALDDAKSEALVEIRKWVEKELVFLEGAAQERVETALEALLEKLRCRAKDLRPGAQDGIVQEVRTWLDGEIRKVAEEAVKRAEAAGVTADQLSLFMGEGFVGV